MKGVLKRNLESKVHADGKTYDNNLYTFRECDYSKVWSELHVQAKVITKKLSKNKKPTGQPDWQQSQSHQNAAGDAGGDSDSDPGAMDDEESIVQVENSSDITPKSYCQIF